MSKGNGGKIEINIEVPEGYHLQAYANGAFKVEPNKPEKKKEWEPREFMVAATCTECISGSGIVVQQELVVIPLHAPRWLQPGENIHVREFKPNEISDTERFDFLVRTKMEIIENGMGVFWVRHPYRYKDSFCAFDSPREAVDSEIKKEKAGLK